MFQLTHLSLISHYSLAYGIQKARKVQKALIEYFLFVIEDKNDKMRIKTGLI